MHIKGDEEMRIKTGIEGLDNWIKEKGLWWDLKIFVAGFIAPEYCQKLLGEAGIAVKKKSNWNET